MLVASHICCGQGLSLSNTGHCQKFRRSLRLFAISCLLSIVELNRFRFFSGVIEQITPS
ncbi:hypothetical protein Plim_0556 [Planctopirus limnophila DSM 3776]|uniref:Uncharacterized protein n=1 Tax=Planctopirus limnophila (strain ATCC 43296 / DSM 3776 / IFAM 1008 / Mu 290) TaxID=521674 RepID=D5SQF2_PLAL2|nr:hypothetical protein Plim_0556 [Planctopirus limnophila DSM 3776]